MGTYDLYSKRNKIKTDVFIYDALSEKLKVQIVFIWTNFFKELPNEFSRELWGHIHTVLCEEFGKKTLLANNFMNDYSDSYRVEYYFENIATFEESLDIIEIVFRVITKAEEIYNNNNYNFLRLNYSKEQAVEDLNTRFLENGVGFSFQQRKLIRVDNTLLHQETIAATFNFLNTTTFQNANQEFLSAHEHFKNKLNKECLTDCLKALETTMKIICSENNWVYNQKDSVKTLIDICFKNKLVPDYLQSQFASLRATLETAIPTLRNRLGGHGQGTQQIIVPDHYVSYMLFLTGTTIVFLVSCQKAIKPFE